MTSSTPRLTVGSVDGQAIEPCIESVRVANGSDVQPSRGQRLLHGVRRRILVVQDQPSDPVESGVGGRGEHGEGIVIAGDRLLDQLSSHRVTSSGGRAGRRRSPIMSREMRPAFHLRLAKKIVPAVGHAPPAWTNR